MPLYEYECEECGEIREVIQKFSDTPLTICSFCCGKLRKLISNNAFHLKGRGWYVTDYGGSPEKQTNGAAGSCESGSKKSVDSKKGETSSKPNNNPN